MRMDADARLVAAAGGVARYFADAAGLAGAAVSDLQSATITVCKQEIGELDEIRAWTRSHADAVTRPH